MHPYTNYYQMRSNMKGKHSSFLESKFEKQKSKDAAKKHAEAEKWRRWRINGHYRKLGDLLHPNMTTKKVKATILTETVCQVKVLRKEAVEAGLLQDKEGWFHGGVTISPQWMFPGECDGTIISPHKGNTIKVTICCEGRPGLFRALTETIRNSGSKAIKAEMAMVGGRVVAEVVVRWPEGGGGEEEEVWTLKRGLKALVENRGLGCNALGHLLGLHRPINNRVMVGGPIGNYWEWENLFKLLSEKNVEKLRGTIKLL